MLGESPHTPFDWRFRLFGIPVRVSATFWILAALVAWIPNRLDLTLLGIACVFVSILVHELGHALTARRFGWSPQIVLYHFGGFAAFQPTWRSTTARRVAVTAAGPAAGFALYAVVLSLSRNVPFTGPLAHALAILLFINLWWNVLNLAPVFPLDGGQIAVALLEAWNGPTGRVWAFRLGTLVGAVLAVLGFRAGQTWMAILFAVLAVQNMQLEQAHY